MGDLLRCAYMHRSRGNLIIGQKNQGDVDGKVLTLNYTYIRLGRGTNC